MFDNSIQKQYEAEAELKAALRQRSLEAAQRFCAMKESGQEKYKGLEDKITEVNKMRLEKGQRLFVARHRRTMDEVALYATLEDYKRWTRYGWPAKMDLHQREVIIKKYEGQVLPQKKPLINKKRNRTPKLDELVGSEAQRKEAMMAVKSEQTDTAHDDFNALTKNSELQKVHDFLLNNSTSGERQFYTDVGAWPTPGGVEEFDIACQNIRELFIRAREVAKEKHFKVELGTDKRADDLKVVCKYKSPYDLNCIGRKRFCSFFVRYRFDEGAGYFVMLDYDELHTHPVNENWKNALIFQNQWFSNRSVYNVQKPQKVAKPSNRSNPMEKFQWILPSKETIGNQSVEDLPVNFDVDIDMPAQVDVNKLMEKSGAEEGDSARTSTEKETNLVELLKQINGIKNP